MNAGGSSVRRISIQSFQFSFHQFNLAESCDFLIIWRAVAHASQLNDRFQFHTTMENFKFHWKLLQHIYRSSSQKVISMAINNGKILKKFSVQHFSPTTTEMTETSKINHHYYRHQVIGIWNESGATLIVNWTMNLNKKFKFPSDFWQPPTLTCASLLYPKLF